MNVVPSTETLAIARAMIRETPKDGADAVLRHLPHLRAEELGALIFLLAREASQARIPPGPTPIGRLKFCVLTADERRSAHAAFVRGEDAPWVIAGEREYQRMRQRKARAAKIRAGKV